MIQNIWLIGGTTESVKIAELLSNANLPCIVSVTTQAARQLYGHISGLNFFIGKIDSNQIINFLNTYQINLVIDATHPYAVTISQGVIAACEENNIPYLRYERPLVPNSSAQVINFPSIEALLNSNYLTGKRVLLTNGSKSLSLFQDYHYQAELFARILPYPESLNMAMDAGFSCDRLIAMRPPFSEELEKALWKLWRIEVVISKASGTSGGEGIKIRVAEALKIPLIIINRPTINYPLVTSKVEDVLSFVRHNFPASS